MSSVPALTWQKLTLKLRHPFRVSYGVSETREAYWIRLHEDEGWGEGTIPPYYRVDAGAMIECWRCAAGLDRALPESVAEVADWVPEGPAPARSALELALFDRLAKQARVPLFELLNLPEPPELPTSFTIGIDTPDAMAEMALSIREYPVLKIKLGSGDEADQDRVRSVRQARPDARLRADANAGWEFAQAQQNLRWLQRFDLELIEQPLPREQIELLGRLQRETPVPLVADESVQTLDDVERLGAAGVAGINLKLMKVGGLSSALRVLERARQLNMKVMLGCMIETSLGTTAMAHLMGRADWVDLDAPLLITNDPFDGVQFDEHARLRVPRQPGIGIARNAREIE